MTFAAEGAAWPEVVQWEASEFGERPDFVYARHTLANELLRSANGRPTHRRWSYALPFTGDRGASYHRFALHIHHRYEPLFGERTRSRSATVRLADAAEWPWRSALVRNRPEAPPARPAVRVLLPLTQTADDQARLPGGTAGLLVLIEGAAFDSGGLAERMEVRGVAVPNPTASYPTEGSVYQFGPDPLRRGTGDPRFEASGGDPQRALRVDGPFGHSLDTGPERHMRTASYIVSPSELGVDDLGWYFLQLRFGRFYEPVLTSALPDTSGRTGATAQSGVGQVAAWTDGRWTQLLPDTRLTPAGGDLRGFQLALSDASTVLTVRGESPVDPAAVPTQARPRVPLPFLALTRHVRDISNRESEVYAGLFRREGVGTWKLMTGGFGVGIGKDPGARYRARLLYVEPGAGGVWNERWAASLQTLSENDFWDRYLHTKDPTGQNPRVGAGSEIACGSPASQSPSTQSGRKGRMSMAELLWRMTRREFLGASALGALSTLSWTRPLLAAGEVPLALCGAGARGRALMDRLAQLPAARVVLVADPDEPALGRALRRSVEGGRLPMATTTDDREVWADPSVRAVLIAAPSERVAPLAEAACRGGKDVYVELPIPHTATALGAVNQAAERHRALVQYGIFALSSEAVQSTLRSLRAGRIGDLRAARIVCMRDAPPPVAGPRVPETLVHEIAVALHGLEAERPAELRALRGTTLDPTSGRLITRVGIVCRFENGRILEFDLLEDGGLPRHTPSAPMRTIVEFIGTSGKMRLDGAALDRPETRFSVNDPPRHLNNFFWRRCAKAARAHSHQDARLGTLAGLFLLNAEQVAQ